MTKEEKQKAIAALKLSAPVKAVTSEEFKDYIQTLNKVMDWLEQSETVTEFADRCRECGKQKTGHWIDGHCSECGCDAPAYIIDWKWQKDINAKYCSNCGARMVKPQLKSEG